MKEMNKTFNERYMDMQELQDSFKISKNYKKYETPIRVRNRISTEFNEVAQKEKDDGPDDNNETLDSIPTVQGKSKKTAENKTYVSTSDINETLDSIPPYCEVPRKQLRRKDL